MPGDWPDGVLDLVVLSEVGYYCGPGDLRTLVDRAAGALAEDGVLVACHWRHPVEEYPLGGDAVHAALRRTPAWRCWRGTRRRTSCSTSWCPPPP